MRIILLSASALVLLVGIAVILWWPSKPLPPDGSGSPSLPTASSTIPGGPSSVQAVKIQEGDPQIKAAFKGQTQNSEFVNFGATTIADIYALQFWSDENKAGQALFKKEEPRGWILLSLGGGAWSATSLVAAGVPADIADALVANAP